MKLDLACGQHCREGFEGVDIAPCKGAEIVVDGESAGRSHSSVMHVVNLLAFPWPFKDGSVEEVYCSHFVEHLPELFWTPDTSAHWTKNLTPYQVDHRSVDLFMRFFDEVYRILAPGGKVTVQVPHGRSSRAFWDPTHRRFLQEQTFSYLRKDWRKANGLEHGAYEVSCDFEIAIGHLLREDANYLRSLCPEDVPFDQWVHARLESWWNVADDMVVTLTKAPVAALAPRAQEEVATTAT